MSEWIDVRIRKPTKRDSPILAFDSLICFSVMALQYMDGWAGPGWYDHSREYGMGLNTDEAFYLEWEGMKFWMQMPEPPKEDVS